MILLPLGALAARIRAACEAHRAGWGSGGGSGEAAPGQSTHTHSRQNDGCAAVRSSPLPMGEGERLFEGQPRLMIYPREAVQVMPSLPDW